MPRNDDDKTHPPGEPFHYASTRYLENGDAKGDPRLHSDKGEDIPRGVAKTLSLRSVEQVEVFFVFGESMVYERVAE